MLSIGRISGATPAATPAVPRTQPGGFAVPGPAGDTKPAEAVGLAADVSALSAMLLLQEVESPQERNRQARQRGEKMLGLLARLQSALLCGGVPESLLAEMRALSDTLPHAADPGLREAVAGIALRCAVEQERLSLLVQGRKQT